MSTQAKKEEITLTLIEAVETLSHIVDLDIDQNRGFIQESTLLNEDRPIVQDVKHWLSAEDAGVTVNVIKKTFRVVLKYLKNVFDEDYSRNCGSQTLERIKTMMVLVGEAAKKLDKYTELFHRSRVASITGLKEYKQLQDFYVNHIAHKIDDRTLGRLVLELSKGTPKERGVKLVGRHNNEANHVFMDLDSVKKDTEYELFFLRKEDGSRFFSPRLIRNIKLVNDFGEGGALDRTSDLLFDMEFLQDRVAFANAKNICEVAKDPIEKFFQTAIHTTNRPIVELLNKALIALKMATNTSNLEHHLPVKNCFSYFSNFQLFLRECLISYDYQRIIAYALEKQSKLDAVIVKLVNSLCTALYTQFRGTQLSEAVHKLIQESNGYVVKDHQEAIKCSKTLSGGLAGEYAALVKSFKRYSGGYLNKILASLEEGDCRSFDPLSQGNLPSFLYSLYVDDFKCLVARWPSPTFQEVINKASINEEFKAFVRSFGDEDAVRKCLLFNFQDRVSWKESARCDALEDLSETSNDHLNVVTIAKDTEFYHQLSPYNNQNQAEAFMKEFKNQLENRASGYFFPEKIRKELLHGFVDRAMSAVHRIFFSGKNMLLREHRMDFIEIFYLFLELKIIDCIQPDIVALSCKDGLDITSTAAAELFVFLKMSGQERLSEGDRETLDAVLYGPCLLTRERIIMPDRFERFLRAVKVIEAVREQYGR
ncbi:MAG: hypothetical protein WCG42_07005, partial [Parachlamydiaceae bacterium]